MRIKKHLIAFLAFLMSFVAADAQNYQLMLNTCVINDTLYINVLAEGPNTLGFRSSDFVFDVYNAADQRGADLIPELDFNAKFIAMEGRWGLQAGTIYDTMHLGATGTGANDDFFNLAIIEEDTTLAGFNMTGGIDTIGVIGVPLRGNWCGDTISLRWRYATRSDSYNNWPGGPMFGDGDIHELGRPLTESIQNRAIFVDATNIVLCSGCGTTSGAAYTLSPANDTVCLGESSTFRVSPSLGDTISFYVNGGLVQQGLLDSLVYTPSAIGIDTIFAIIGDPQCLACADTSTESYLVVNNGLTLGFDVQPFGCDSVTLTATPGWSNYFFYGVGGTPHPGNPHTSNTINVASPGAGTYTISVGVSGGACPDSTFKDTTVTFSSSGISVDVGIDTVVLCLGESVTINSGYSLANVNSITWRLDSLTNTSFSTGETRSYSFTTAPPPFQRWVYITVDSAGCIGSDSILGIHNFVRAAITPVDTSYCDVDTLILHAANHIGTATVDWYFNGGSGFNLIDPNVDSTFVMSTANGGDGPGEYGYIIENTMFGKTCADTTSRVISEIVCNVNANFTTNVDTVCIFSPTNIIASNTSIGDTVWFWDFGTGAVPATSTDSMPGAITYTTGRFKRCNTLYIWSRRS